MGEFNLVHAPAYRACGGYEALRLTVVDDLRLGLLLRRAGKRTRGFLGGDDAECHWGTTVRGMVQIMEKNYFAAAGLPGGGGPGGGPGRDAALVRGRPRAARGDGRRDRHRARAALDGPPRVSLRAAARLAARRRRAARR